MELAGGWDTLGPVAFDSSGRIANPEAPAIKSVASSLKQSFLLAEHVYDTAFPKRGSRLRPPFEA